MESTYVQFFKWNTDFFKKCFEDGRRWDISRIKASKQKLIIRIPINISLLSDFSLITRISSVLFFVSYRY